MKIALLFLLPLSGWACECAVSTIQTDVQSTSFIAVGRVIELLDTDQDRENYVWRQPGHAHRVRFEVQEAFKGLSPGQVITIESNFNDCAFYFKYNAEYVLFIEKFRGHYMAHICTYSGRTESSQDTIRYLRRILPAVKHKD